jgi:hypothetical protein
MRGRPMALAAAVMFALAGCGSTGPLTEGQRSVRAIEVIFKRCGEERGNGFSLCVLRNEKTIKRYVARVCRHLNGYVFEGKHVQCPKSATQPNRLRDLVERHRVFSVRIPKPETDPQTLTIR